MKKLISIIAVTVCLVARSQVIPVITKSKNLEVTTQLSLGGKAVKKVSTDSTLSENSGTSIPSEKAVKSYVDVSENYVNVKKFGAVGNGTTDDTQALRLAFASKRNLFMPDNYRVTDSVRIAEGCSILFKGNITGTGFLRALGDISITGNGNFKNTPVSCQLLLGKGNIIVSNINFIDNFTSTCAVLISPSSEIYSIKITDCRFENINYGILKQGYLRPVVKNVLIANNTFKTLHGDAVEWNNATDDRSVVISKNIIDGINGNNVNWGIAIGIAGGTYSNYNNRIEDILVEGNIISNVRQGIHFEACNRFVVKNNILKNVSDTFSTNAGLDVAGIVAYGCRDFEFSSNTFTSFRNGDAVVLSTGVVAGEYVQPCIGAKINFNTLNNAGKIYAASAGDADTEIGNNFLNGGSTIQVLGASRLRIHDNVVSAPDGTTGLTVDFYSAGGSVAAFNPSTGVGLVATNNQVYDSKGRSLVSFSNINDGVLPVQAQGNNFGLVQSSKNIAVANRTIISNIGFPYGVELNVNDLVFVKDSSKTFVVTGAGSRNRDDDYFYIINRQTVASSNYPWTLQNTGGHHSVGQRLRLAFSLGGEYFVTVKRVYISGGTYRIDFDESLPSGFLNGASGAIVAANAVTYQ